MKTASAKAKGRSLAKKIAECLVRIGGLDIRDVRVTSSGVTGADITFSPLGASIWPFSIECKKHARFSIYEHFDQAVSNTKEGQIAALIIEANRREPLIVLDATSFLQMWRDLQ